MGKFLVAALMLSLLNHGAGAMNTVSAWDDQDFFRYCPPSRCSEDGPEIRFPLRLETSNTSSSCGAACTKLACSGQDTILLHPALGRCNVTAIDYEHAVISFVPLVDSLPACPIQKFISTSIPDVVDHSCASRYDLEYAAILVGCSKEFTPSGTSPAVDYSFWNATADYVVGPISCLSNANTAADYVVGPISCLSYANHFSYLVYNQLYMSVLPLDCKQMAERIISFAETNVSWDRGEDIPFIFAEGTFPSDRGDIPSNCRHCEIQGRRCAFSPQRNQTFCEPRGPHGPRVKVIAATSSVAAFVVLSLMVASVLYLSLKSRYDEEVHLKVEMFLKTYGTSKPTRYTFSDVKKIARLFKEKIGQGGFGSVYKGELPNGVPVAVKMLENSIGEGEEFINEVATIGRIHHANIVCLLGFCSEGTRRALIYEFMPNESLEKYIFLHDSNISQELLIPHKMIDIALSIARGMEYLHQGCNQRILHFDIKPHNILLDYNFNPKISDFGLAKMCARDQSIITLTAARGAMGYIALELYSRNFGGISYKSDVYSFGMPLLEMVSGRRNSDPGIESQNEVYLPEWVYEKVITGQELVLTREKAQEEKEKVRQLPIVALWCIQWNPKNRPSMTEVVNMLTGRLQNLKMPPKPFVPSASDPMQ